MSARLRGGKECGPNPTDRAKPGVKDHILCDGRGVPLSVVVTAANVNDSPTLAALLNNCAVVRPPSSTLEPQHLCLDAAYDNAPAHRVVLVENYEGHIAPKRGRDHTLPRHESGKARRWIVEVVHAWHDRFRRLVVNWEKTTESRYAFLCLANALIAYRM
jgi:putative transposase